MEKPRICAVILTKNEKRNIEKCLASVSWCDEIIIVDDYSQDETLQKARNSKSETREKIKTYQRHLSGDFAAQRNFGLEKAASDWVLFVDADEVISDKLKNEILDKMPKLVQYDEVGYYLKRRDYFMGKWLMYGETANIRLLRLAKKDAGRWKGKVHEVWEAEGERKELENPVLHYPHETISEFLKDINGYTDLVAQYWKEQGRRIGFWEIGVYPFGKFFQNYVWRLGFLDGTAGFIMAVFMSFHSFLARSKYWLKYET